MPNQIQQPYPETGATTLYAIVRDPNTGYALDTTGPTFVPYAEIDRAAYAIPLVEQDVGAHHYCADLPAGTPAGAYVVTCYYQLGAAPAGTDDLIGMDGRLEWDGAAVPAMAAVPAGVWSTQLPAAYQAGTAGYAVGAYLDSPVSAAGGGASAEAIATAVWAADVSGSYTAAQAGNLLNEATASAEADAVAASVVNRPVLTVTSPSARVVDANGNQLTEVTVGQILAALMVVLAGDRSGIGSRTITGTMPGAPGTAVAVTRSGSSAIEAVVVLPPAV